MGGGRSSDSYSYSNIPFNPSREIAKDFSNESYTQGVNSFLGSQLSEYNNKDSDQIRYYLDEIKSAINQNIDGTVDTRFGGSVSKKTFVEGLSDVDTLVFLNNSSLESLSPRDVKNYFLRLLKSKFPKAEIKKGRLSITVKFKDYELQLLPAVKTSKGIKIADETGNAWSKNINPSAFARELTVVNSKNSNKVIPTIKIIKSINSSFNKNEQLSGYHIESLAVEIFKNYDGRKTYKEMVNHFFQKAPNMVMNPIKERTGQSKYVDDYLGNKESLTRGKIASTLLRVQNKLKTADKRQSLDDWAGLLL